MRASSSRQAAAAIDPRPRPIAACHQVDDQLIDSERTSSGDASDTSATPRTKGATAATSPEIVIMGDQDGVGRRGSHHQADGLCRTSPWGPKMKRNAVNLRMSTPAIHREVGCAAIYVSHPTTALELVP